MSYFVKETDLKWQQCCRTPSNFVTLQVKRLFSKQWLVESRHRRSHGGAIRGQWTMPQSIKVDMMQGIKNTFLR